MRCLDIVALIIVPALLSFACQTPKPQESLSDAEGEIVLGPSKGELPGLVNLGGGGCLYQRSSCSLRVGPVPRRRVCRKGYRHQTEL